MKDCESRRGCNSTRVVGHLELPTVAVIWVSRLYKYSGLGQAGRHERPYKDKSLDAKKPDGRRSRLTLPLLFPPPLSNPNPKTKKKQKNKKP